MRRTKTPAQLRMDIARVFFNRTDVRKCYGLEEAVALLREIDAGPHAFDECFGGSLKGGMYKHELRSTLTAVFKDTDAVIAALREQPDTTLDILTPPTVTESVQDTETAADSTNPDEPPLLSGGGPAGPLRTRLTFQQLQAVVLKLGQQLSCSLCGHSFSPDAETAHHACNQPRIANELVSVQPMTAPVDALFYTEYVYGTKI
jgi:hypothetical protein